MTGTRRPAGRTRLAAVLIAAAVALSIAPPAGAQALEGRVTRITLDNGFRFLLVRRGTAPVFAANLRFRVGSVDDPPGQSGLAHFFEHMAFKGTSTIGARDAAAESPLLDDLDRAARALNRELDRGDGADPDRLKSLRADLQALQQKAGELVVKDELTTLYQNNGAVGLNASTSTDLTSYVVSLPSNRLELWCLLESARLRDPVLREFYSERDVVQEERRMRIETRPFGRLYEQMLLAAFSTSPYRIATVGLAADLERLTRPDALAFRKTHYVPGNAVAALVGDLDPAASERLLRRYFADLPAGPPAPPPRAAEAAQAGERRVTVEFDAEPDLMIAFHKPSWPDPDDPVFRIIDSLLTSGRTSRLFRSLVLDRRLAADVSTFEAPGDRYPNLFVVRAQPQAPHTAAEVEAAIGAELRRLADEPIGADEMAKVRSEIEASFLYPLRSNAGLASQLSYFDSLRGDWRDLLRYRDALLGVTADRVREVARRAFSPSNRTVAFLARPAPQEASP